MRFMLPFVQEGAVKEMREAAKACRDISLSAAAAAADAAAAAAAPAASGAAVAALPGLEMALAADAGERLLR